MNRSLSVWTVLLMAATVYVVSAAPIIMRHDRDEAAYLDLGQRYGAALCHVRNDRGVVNGEGTLIAPRWVLTAAHVARGLQPGDVLEIGGAAYPIDRVVLHPQWRARTPAHDIALVRLQQAVAAITPVPLYRNGDEAGREIVLVGAGMRGTGRSGPVEDDGQVRGATNRIDEVGDTWLRFVFDAPGTANATDLEGISGPGDSGGPVFLLVDDVAHLAGISSGQDAAAAGGQPGRYGVSEYYTRVSRYLAWIERTMQAPPAEADDDLAEKLDAYMQRLIAQGFSGGLLVAQGGEVVLSKGYGMADRARRLPFTNTTVFPVGSIAKQFTGAAVLKLEMMGKLRVEDPITRYFEGVPADKAGITLHHLLTHSAGLPDALGYDFAEISRDDYIKQALDAELAFTPGAGYQYSNVGFSLLAAIIEQRTGGSYDAFVQEHLFKPAGMTKTGYVLSRWPADDLAHGYRGDEDGGTFADKAWADDGPYWHLRGNGGILSILDDLYAWHQALEGDAVLSEAAKRKYYTPHVREGEGAPSFYGYGWVVADTPRGTLITHNGGNPYFSNDFLRYVDADVVIYITSNTSTHRAPRFSQTLADIVFGDPYELPPERIETVQIEDLAATPVGRRARAYLDLIASDDDEAIAPFVDTHLTPRVLEKYSMEEIARQFKKDQQEIGVADVARIVKTGAHSLEVTVQSRATKAWWLLRLQVDPEAPHRLVGIGVSDTMPPEGTVVRAQAAQPEESKWRLPDSPTGRALAALLTTIEEGSEEQVRRFVGEHFDETFRNNHPMEAHLAVFRELHDSLPDLEISQVRKTGPFSAEFMLTSGRSGQKVKGSFTLQSTPPHRFSGLFFEPVDEQPDGDG